MTRLQIGRAASRLAIATVVPAMLALLGTGNVHAHTPGGIRKPPAGFLPSLHPS